MYPVPDLLHPELLGFLLGSFLVAFLNLGLKLFLLRGEGLHPFGELRVVHVIQEKIQQPFLLTGDGEYLLLQLG